MGGQGGFGPQMGGQGQQHGGQFPGGSFSPFPSFPSAPEQGNGRQGCRCGGRGFGAPMVYGQAGMGFASTAPFGGRMEGGRGGEHNDKMLIAVLALSSLSIVLSIAVLVVVVRLGRSMGYMRLPSRGSVSDIAPPSYASNKGTPNGSTTKVALGDAFERVPVFERQVSTEQV
eukprot:Opistho-1_new@4082